MSERDREWGDDGEIDLFSGVMFLWRARYFAIALGIVGALAGFAVARLQAPSYRASTNIFVAVPVAFSQVVADATDVDAIDRLSRTDAVQDMVRAAAGGRGEQIAGFRTVVDRSLTDLRPSLATLTLLVTASDPELAREAADSWAKIVVQEESKRASATRASILEFFGARYKAATDRLLEQQRVLEKARKERGADVAVETAEVENAKANFIRAGKRLDEAETVTANRDAAIRVGSPAAPAVAQRSSARKLIAAGAAAGVLLGLVAAWIRTRLAAA